MARRVYFAFHYQRDIFRVNVVRNAHVIEGVAAAGFSDGSLWEEAKRKGDAAIKALIDKGLEGSSVTAVLIGAQTAHGEYVEYEIHQSWKRGNGLLGIHIHNIKDAVLGRPDIKGDDPFVKLGYTGIRTYDWVLERGYDSIGAWVEAAYNQDRQNKPAPIGREALLGWMAGQQPPANPWSALSQTLLPDQPPVNPWSALSQTVLPEQPVSNPWASLLSGVPKEEPRPSLIESLLAELRKREL